MTRCGVFARFVSRKWMMRQRFRTPEGRTQRRATTNIDNTTKGEKHQQPEESRHGHDRTSWSRTDMVIIRKACRGRKGWKGGREATEVIGPVMVGKIVADSRQKTVQPNQPAGEDAGRRTKKEATAAASSSDGGSGTICSFADDGSGWKPEMQPNQSRNQPAGEEAGRRTKKEATAAASSSMRRRTDMVVSR